MADVAERDSVIFHPSPLRLHPLVLRYPRAIITSPTQLWRDIHVRQQPATDARDAQRTRATVTRRARRPRTRAAASSACAA